MLTRRTLLLTSILFGTVAAIARVSQVQAARRTAAVTAQLELLSTHAPYVNQNGYPGLTPRAFGEGGVDLRVRDRYGHTVLMYAARLGDEKLLRYALDRHAPSDEQDENGYTALTYAAIADRPDLIRLLVKQGADPRGPRDAALSPLLDACLHGNLTSVRELLRLGALTRENYASTLARVEDRQRLWSRIHRRLDADDFSAREAATKIARCRVIHRLLLQHRP